MYGLYGSTEDIVGSSLSGLQTGVAYTVIVSSTAPFTGELIEMQPKTAEERINSLIDEINALVDGGMLNKGQGISLIVKLQNALEKLNANQAVISINMLWAFTNQVSSLIQEGVLTQDVGQALIDEAYQIIEMINN